MLYRLQGVDYSVWNKTQPCSDCFSPCLKITSSAFMMLNIN